MLGYQQIGTGTTGVIIMNDWLSDTSTWESARLYLDLDNFAWVFADLPGYGKSRDLTGPGTAQACAAEIIALADHLTFEKFVIIGHSMSTIVALHLAQSAPHRLLRVVLLCPVPPTSLEVNSSIVPMLEAVATGPDEVRTQAVQQTTGGRLCEGWVRFKVNRWRATSSSDAVLRYIPLFATDGVPNPSATTPVPVLAVTGEQDDEVMRSEAVTKIFTPICPNLTVVPIAECGHYPMQETPPLLATIVTRFLASTQ
ncbi:MAG: alpha/beta hydrolase [Deltaproteobacteria bacterium]|nr:alpha/beta hydrolase [Deltaproteobacteria bacterium]